LPKTTEFSFSLAEALDFGRTSLFGITERNSERPHSIKIRKLYGFLTWQRLFSVIVSDTKPPLAQYEASNAIDVSD
jgi:hypothetical protein